MEFPPADKATLIDEDVRALFKLVGISCIWSPAQLSFRLMLHDEQYVADMLVDCDQLQDIALVQLLVRTMVIDLERARAR